MNAVFEKTRELGDALMASEEYLAMKAAEDAAMADADAAAMMGNYLEHKQQIQEILESGNPDADELARHKDAMDEIQRQFQEIPAIAKMNEAREGFDTLISQVNQVLRFIITGEMGDPEGCGGSCASCPGCH